MKHKNLSRLRRIISGNLVLAMTAATLSVMPAAADKPIETARTYSGNGYEVRYDITGAWGEYQNIQVTLKNIGNEPIQNWALKYDLQGEVDNIWNGTVVSNSDDWSIVKNAGYNYEIKPDSSVSYGYIISGNDLDLPDSIELCSERSAVSDSNYSVTLSVDSDWGSGFTGNISVKNLGDTPIEAWHLSFDTNFDLVNVWNAEVLSSDNNSYVVSSTYASAIIEPDKTVTFGFQGIKDNDISPKLSNVFMSSVIINTDTIPHNDDEISSQSDSGDDSSTVDSQPDDSSSLNDDSSSSTDDSSSTSDSSETDSKPDIEIIKSEDLSISAFGEYNDDEHSIDIEWYTNAAGEYEVQASADNENYDSLIKVKDFTTYRYHMDEDFDVKYFKVKVTVDNKYAESIPFMAVKSADGYSIEFVDSDGDQIPDIYEQMLGTDKDNEDTDNDGLTDYQEVYITGTDPTVYDSVTSDVADAAADCDGDGLSNVTEISIGTEVNYPDSDGDGLNDGEEVNIYGTDPLKYDTDDDEISDGDEVALGLNPLSGSSDGKTSDKERKFEQHIDKDSNVFAAVNTEENAFNVSMDISAAGNAETLLSSDKSGYANVIESDAVLGIVPEFEYEEGFDVDDVKLNFDIKPEYVENTNGKYAAVSDEFAGIKRLNVFKYFDDIDMLLPIKTTYDIENNRVSTHVDELGTYCLVDMEQWFEALEVDPSMFETIMLSPNAIGAVGIPVNTYLISSAASTNVKELAPLDVIFHVYTKNSTQLPDIRSEIIKTSELLFEKYDNVHVYVATYTGTFTSINGKSYATNKSDLETMISNLSSCSSRADIPDLYVGLGAAVNNYLNTSPSELSDRYYILLEKAVIETTKLSDAADLLLDHNMKAIVLSNLNDFKGLAGYTEGLFYPKTINYNKDVSDFIIDKHGSFDAEEEKYDYPIIAATGWKRIYLDAPISDDYEVISERIRLGEDPREKYTSEYVDADADGLLDLEEIRYLVVDKIFGKDIRVTWDDKGNVVLPTLEQVMKIKEELPYMEDGIKGIPLEYYSNFRILPLKSDPSNHDEDNDGVFDNIDLLPLLPCFSGTMSDSYVEKYNINFRFDYSAFFGNNYVYNKDLAVLGSIFANLTYVHEDLEEGVKPTSIDINYGANLSNAKIIDVYKYFGLTDYEDYELSKNGYHDDDISQMFLGHRKVKYHNETKEIIFVSVRGTDGTIEEWSSNFDVGADDENYWDRDNVYWKNKMNHKGFDVAANRLYEHINEYIMTATDSSVEKVIFIVGHSRGAAISNILGTKFNNFNNIKAFVYTYATPNTVEIRTGETIDDYGYINNIVNEDDLVPQLPLTSWNFTKYGNTYSSSIVKNHENKYGKRQKGTWEWLFDNDYNYNGQLKNTLNLFESVIDNNDRKNIYQYSDTVDSAYWFVLPSTKNPLIECRNRKDKYGKRISRFCEIMYVPSIVNISIKVEQSPAFFMMVLSDLTAHYYHDYSNGTDNLLPYVSKGSDEDNLLGVSIGYFVAQKYEKAKKSFVLGGADSASELAASLNIGGMTHGHMPGTYYFLSNHCNLNKS